MEEFLPSDIARAVYGYLLAEGCEDAGKTFLETSSKLTEFSNRVKQGKSVTHAQTLLLGQSLTDMLNISCHVYSLMHQAYEKQRNDGDGKNKEIMSDLVVEMWKVVMAVGAGSKQIQTLSKDVTKQDRVVTQDNSETLQPASQDVPIQQTSKSPVIRRSSLAESYHSLVKECSDVMDLHNVSPMKWPPMNQAAANITRPTSAPGALDIMEPHWANSCSTTTSVSVAFTQPIVVPAVATTITRLPDPPIIVLNNQNQPLVDTGNSPSYFETSPLGASTPQHCTFNPQDTATIIYPPIISGRPQKRGINKSNFLKRPTALRRLMPKPPRKDPPDVIHIQILPQVVEEEENTENLQNAKEEFAKPLPNLCDEDTCGTENDNLDTQISQISPQIGHDKNNQISNDMDTVTILTENSKETNKDASKESTNTNDVFENVNENIRISNHDITLNKESTTPKLHILKKNISRSTPRKNSHVRALSFNTPNKPIESRKFNTSPKMPRIRFSPRTSKLNSIKRSSLFKSPTIPKRHNELTQLTEEEHGDVIEEKNSIYELSLSKVPIATISPTQKLSSAWKEVNDVTISTTNHHWDEKIRSFIRGDFVDPAPPSKKQTKSTKRKFKPTSEESKNVTEEKKTQKNLVSRRSYRLNKKANQKCLSNSGGVSTDDEAQTENCSEKVKAKQTNNKSKQFKKSPLVKSIKHNISGKNTLNKKVCNLKCKEISSTSLASCKNKNNTTEEKCTPDSSFEEVKSNSSLVSSAEDVLNVSINNIVFDDLVLSSNSGFPTAPNEDKNPKTVVKENDSTFDKCTETIAKRPDENSPKFSLPTILHSETPCKDNIVIPPETPVLNTPLIKTIRQETSCLEEDLLLTPSLPPTPSVCSPKQQVITPCKPLTCAIVNNSKQQVILNYSDNINYPNPKVSPGGTSTTNGSEENTTSSDEHSKTISDNDSKHNTFTEVETTHKTSPCCNIIKVSEIEENKSSISVILKKKSKISTKTKAKKIENIDIKNTVFNSTHRKQSIATEDNTLININDHQLQSKPNKNVNKKTGVLIKSLNLQLDNAISNVVETKNGFTTVPSTSTEHVASNLSPSSDSPDSSDEGLLQDKSSSSLSSLQCGYYCGTTYNSSESSDEELDNNQSNNKNINIEKPKIKVRVVQSKEPERTSPVKKPDENKIAKGSSKSEKRKEKSTVKNYRSVKGEKVSTSNSKNVKKSKDKVIKVTTPKKLREQLVRQEKLTFKCRLTSSDSSDSEIFEKTRNSPLKTKTSLFSEPQTKCLELSNSDKSTSNEITCISTKEKTNEFESKALGCHGETLTSNNPCEINSVKYTSDKKIFSSNEGPKKPQNNNKCLTENPEKENRNTAKSKNTYQKLTMTTDSGEMGKVLLDEKVVSSNDRNSFGDVSSSMDPHGSFKLKSDKINVTINSKTDTNKTENTVPRPPTPFRVSSSSPITELNVQNSCLWESTEEPENHVTVISTTASRAVNRLSVTGLNLNPDYKVGYEIDDNKFTLSLSKTTVHLVLTSGPLSVLNTGREPIDQTSNDSKVTNKKKRITLTPVGHDKYEQKLKIDYDVVDGRVIRKRHDRCLSEDLDVLDCSYSDTLEDVSCGDVKQTSNSNEYCSQLIIPSKLVKTQHKENLTSNIKKGTTEIDSCDTREHNENNMGQLLCKQKPKPEMESESLYQRSVNKMSHNSSIIESDTKKYKDYERRGDYKKRDFSSERNPRKHHYSRDSHRYVDRHRRDRDRYLERRSYASPDNHRRRSPKRMNSSCSSDRKQDYTRKKEKPNRFYHDESRSRRKHEQEKDLFVQKFKKQYDDLDKVDKEGRGRSNNVEKRKECMDPRASCVVVYSDIERVESSCDASSLMDFAILSKTRNYLQGTEGFHNPHSSQNSKRKSPVSDGSDIESKQGSKRMKLDEVDMKEAKSVLKHKMADMLNALHPDTSNQHP